MSNIKEIKVQALVIEGAPALDPVTVIFRGEGPSRGGVIIECYGKSWSAYWGGMGNATVREFVTHSDPEYLMTKLWRDGEKRTKATEGYLLRIATAVIAALNP